MERFLGELTQDRDVIREGSFASVPALVRDIESYLAERNLHPGLRKTQRARQALEAQRAPAG